MNYTDLDEISGKNFTAFIRGIINFDNKIHLINSLVQSSNETIFVYYLAGQEIEKKIRNLKVTK